MESKHFSHHHPLTFHHLPQPSHHHCSACKSLASGDIYVCWQCNYFLHDRCFRATRSLNHPSHLLHPLTLSPFPTYPSSSFFCNSCNLAGDAFSYSCSTCEFDLHLNCALTPTPNPNSNPNPNPYPLYPPPNLNPHQPSFPTHQGLTYPPNPTSNSNSVYPPPNPNPQQLSSAMPQNPIYPPPNPTSDPNPNPNSVYPPPNPNPQQPSSTIPQNPIYPPPNPTSNPNPLYPSNPNPQQPSSTVPQNPTYPPPNPISNPNPNPNPPPPSGYPTPQNNLPPPNTIAANPPPPPPPESIIKHFNHPHTLKQIEIEKTKPKICSACECELAGPAYCCTESYCTFNLHKACFDSPRELKHPSHHHHLTLLAATPYANGSFRCDACRKSGKAFVYTCATCSYDLHIDCVRLPETVVRSDHGHALSLCYTPPVAAGGKAFVCRVCHEAAEEMEWVYYCRECGFGTHLECVLYNVKKQDATAGGASSAAAAGGDEAASYAEELCRLQMAQMNLDFQMQMAKQQAEFMNSIANSWKDLI